MIVAAAVVVGMLAPLHLPAHDPVYVVPSPWIELATCESGPDWSEGDGGIEPFRGGLQWHPATWADVAPDGAPTDPAEASPRQEVQAAETLLSRPWGGFGHWPVCARKIGLLP